MVKTKTYVSGHCSANVVGGHARCAHYCAGTECTCWCHIYEWIEGSTYVDRSGVTWRCDGAGWYVDD